MHSGSNRVQFYAGLSLFARVIVNDKPAALKIGIYDSSPVSLCLICPLSNEKRYIN